MTGSPTPADRPADGPRALLSPDGKLLAWRTGAKHFQWRGTDGYDRMPEDVADWTPLVPAVSVPPVGTDGLRAQFAQRFSDVDARDWGGDHGFVPSYGSDTESDAFVDAAVAVFEQAHGDLVRVVATWQALFEDKEEWETAAKDAWTEVKTLTVERDALSRMLRGMARERSESRREYNSVARALRVKQEFQRGVSEVLAEFGLAGGVRRLVPDTVDALRAVLASRSTPPQDAGLPDDAVARFDAVFDVAIRLFRELSTGEHGYPGAPARRTRWVTEGRIDAYHQVLSAAREWRAWLSAPATDPVPATPDGPKEWGVRYGEFGRVQPLANEDDAREFLAAFTLSPAELVTRPVNEWQPVAPQAPAEPTGDAVLLDVAEDRVRRDTGERHALDEVIADLAGPDVPEAGKDASPGPHHPAGSPEAHFQSVRRATGNEVDGSSPAVPGDTEDDYGDSVLAPFLSGQLHSYGGERPGFVDNYGDSHRADTTRPEPEK